MTTARTRDQENDSLAFLGYTAYGMARHNLSEDERLSWRYAAEAIRTRTVRRGLGE